MKKLALVLAATFSVAGAGAALADSVPVPGLGTLFVNERGYTVLADGEGGPVSGYIGITDDGNCAGALEGTPEEEAPCGDAQ